MITLIKKINYELFGVESISFHDFFWYYGMLLLILSKFIFTVLKLKLGG